MYRCKSLAKLLIWHKNGISSDGLVQCVPDSMSWKHINDKWLDFAIDSCNVKLGLTFDGVNPFGDLSSCHFTWPMILLNYNLPPWLVTKRYFLMLALIILGKKSVIYGNLDVYLQPLIKELQVLWQGVQAFDAILWVPFTLKAMSMWSIYTQFSYLWIIYRLCNQKPCGMPTL
jgi:hypothetical protein